MKTLEGKEIVSAAIATLNAVEADASNQLPERIHLLRVGKFPTQKYGDLEISADDLNEFVDNFQKGYGRPGENGAGSLPVNFGHDKGGKAAAWITSLEADGTNLWGNVEWTGSGKQSIEAKDYQFISSEFTPRCLGGVWASAEGLVKGIRNVFTGAALTNIPMFNGNKGIMASAESVDSDNDKQVIYINATEKEQSMNLDVLRVKDAASLTDEEKQFVEAHASDLSDDEKKKFNIQASAEEKNVTPVSVEAAATSEGVVSVEASEIKKLVDANAELTSKVEASENAKSDLQKQVEAHADKLKEIEAKEVEASIDEQIKAGRIKSDQRDKWVARVQADATVLDDIKAMPVHEVLAAEVGSSKASESTSALEETRTKVKEVMASENGTKDYAVALTQVFASTPGLEERYNTEVRG